MSKIPGTIAIQIWGLCKVSILSRKEAVMFWNELKNKMIPENTEDIIK